MRTGSRQNAADHCAKRSGESHVTHSCNVDECCTAAKSAREALEERYTELCHITIEIASAVNHHGCWSRVERAVDHKLCPGSAGTAETTSRATFRSSFRNSTLVSNPFSWRSLSASSRSQRRLGSRLRDVFHIHDETYILGPSTVPEDNAADWQLSCASGRRGVISKSEGVDRIYRGTVWSWRNDSTQRSLYENS